MDRVVWFWVVALRLLVCLLGQDVVDHILSRPKLRCILVIEFDAFAPRDRQEIFQVRLEVRVCAQAMSTLTGCLKESLRDAA